MKKQKRFMMYIEAQERKMNVEIPESVRDEMLTFFRKEETYQRVRRYHNAYYSLDRDDGLENEISDVAPSPEEIIIHREERGMLHAALMSLPAVQRRRLDLHIMHGLSIAQIARMEGVSWSAVDRSVKRGIDFIKNYVEDYM